MVAVTIADIMTSLKPHVLQSFAPANWWSAAALCGLMTGGSGAPRIFHRRRPRRGFMVGGGGVSGVRPNERTLKQRTRWTGVFSLVLQGSATSPVISAVLLTPQT